MTAAPIARPIFNRAMTPNINTNSRGRKTTRRGRKLFFEPAIFEERFRAIEQVFAWENSNHCCRLIANVVIAYNSMLLPGLLSRYLATSKEMHWTCSGGSRQRRGSTCTSLDTTHSATNGNRLIWKLFWLGVADDLACLDKFRRFEFTTPGRMPS